MIIDTHTHLMNPDVTPQPFWDSWVEMSALIANRPLERVKRRLPEFWDLSGEVIVQEMDKAGIDKSIIAVVDWGLGRHLGEPKMGIEEINKLYADVAKKFPDRLIAFAGIDPRRKGAAKSIETFVTEWGMKGIKLHPAMGFYPNDKICYPIYEKAAELKLPILFHTGDDPRPVYFKFAQPIYLQEVAVDFPDIPIILGHAGGCWQNEAMAICTNHTNVYLDLALWQTKLLRPLEFYRALRTMLNSVSWQRVLFGSDFPMLKLLVSQERWVKAFTEIPESVREQGIEFTKDEIDGILGGNATNILKLSK